MLELSKQDAADIVDQLSKLINMKINIVNSKSIIIANSDESRVGDFHEATKRIIEDHLTELIVKKDTQFSGTQAGTNLPLIINNEIIGVVGITGEVKTAKAYGQIIKKMCEILIQGKARDILIEQRKREKELFQIEWICEKDILITDSFIAEGNSYDINIMLKRRVLVFSPKVKDDRNAIINTILIDDKNNIAFKNRNIVVAAITDRANDKVIQLVEKIKLKIKNSLKVGIDEQDYNMNINDQYLKAYKSLQTISSNTQSIYIFYEDLFIELLEDEISLKRKKEYVLKIFHNYTNYYEIRKAIHLIKTLYDQDSSLKAAADILGMHPNTLQYQLKKIYSKTNLDPRTVNNIGIYILAIKFSNDILGVV
ncbi:MAG: helix-turn-helix domain-containing protein [Spirochaetaceae bacterium]|nr:helix-turn-helix domain-containing protein [Spirochaetaceae bacterium]